MYIWVSRCVVDRTLTEGKTEAAKKKKQVERQQLILDVFAFRRPICRKFLCQQNQAEKNQVQNLNTIKYSKGNGCQSY